MPGRIKSAMLGLLTFDIDVNRSCTLFQQLREGPLALCGEAHGFPAPILQLGPQSDKTQTALLLVVPFPQHAKVATNGAGRETTGLG